MSWSSACTAAAEQGGVLQWLRSQDPPCPWSVDVCIAAVRAGQLEVLQWPVTCPYPHRYRAWSEYVSEEAAKGGHLGVLQWLREQNLLRPRSSLGSLPLCTLAAQGGQLEALQRLRSHNPPFLWTINTAVSAAMLGHLTILQWLKSQDCPWCTASRMHAAALRGHLEILQWLRDQDPLCPWNSDTCIFPAKLGCCEVLQWLRSQDPPAVWDQRTCVAAAVGGRLEVLQWLRRQHPPCPWSEDVSRYAAEMGRLEVLQWLCCQEPPCPWFEGIYHLVASRGRLHILQWLRSQSPPRAWGPFSLPRAVEYGHKDVVGWALLHGCPSQKPGLETLRRQLVCLTCVAHQQRNRLMSNSPACKLGQYVLQLPSDVIKHIATFL